MIDIPLGGIFLTQFVKKLSRKNPKSGSLSVSVDEGRKYPNRNKVAVDVQKMCVIIETGGVIACQC
jgi:hypothetical protein